MNIKDFLEVEDIEAELDRRETLIKSANSLDLKSLQAIPVEWRRGLTREEMFNPESETWKDGVIKKAVAGYRDKKQTAKCIDCAKDFQFFTISPLLPKVWGLHEQELRRIPERCLDCEMIARDRRLLEERLDGFFSSNPLAEGYCSTVGKPPRPVQYQSVVEWRQMSGAKHGGLIAIGDSYLGKTTAIYHLAKTLVEQECCEVFCANVDHLNQLSKVTDNSIAEMIDEMKEVEVLLLDDIDKVRITPRVASEIYGIVEHRFKSSRLPKPILLTMNTTRKRDFIKLFSPDKGEADSKKVGVSIYNRLADKCDFIDFSEA